MTNTRRARVDLLSTEADVQRQAATDRANSVQNKASFVVVAAGLLTTSSVITPDKVGGLVAIPLVLTLATVILSAVALWPAHLKVVEPRLLTDKWLDTKKSDDDLAAYLLEAKVEAFEQQQARTDTRVKALKASFVLFSVSVAATVVVAIFASR
jgi:p-aminobenzoyl-glutamate transporter AbgT